MANFIHSFSSSIMSPKLMANVFYWTCDRSLMMFQRILFCAVIFLGYEMRPESDTSFDASICQMFARIIRNFFYVAKAVRKWLSITFNDGIIPPAPIKSDRKHGSSKAYSTPNSRASSYDEFGKALKPSPIEHRYSDQGKDYSIVMALKERNKSVEGDHLYYSDSDFLGHSSMSLRTILKSLYQSFTGSIEDPDEVKPIKRDEKEVTGASDIDLSENDPSFNLATNSIIEQSQQMSVFNRNNTNTLGNGKKKPSPPDFDFTTKNQSVCMSD